MRESLEGEGHIVEEAADGEAAIQALSASEFDLAFLDIRMPGASGLDVLEQIRATGTQTAIVIITVPPAVTLRMALH